MTTYTIKGKQNETFTIGKVEDMTSLKSLAAKLADSGKEVAIYHMERVVEGTRKKAFSLMCYRFVGTDTFITVL